MTKFGMMVTHRIPVFGRQEVGRSQVQGKHEQCIQTLLQATRQAMPKDVGSGFESVLGSTVEEMMNTVIYGKAVGG